jgi:5-epi-alpha-selinene synthase
METIVLPRLYCPFPSAVNKHAESLHQHTIEWVRKFNLISDEAAYQKFCQSRFSDLAARVYPDAAFTELKLLSDWNVWTFIIDDQMDEGAMGKQPEQLAAFYAGLVNVLKGKDTAYQIEPLGAALNDLRQRIMQQKVESVMIRRFIGSVEACLSAFVWEAKNRARGNMPDVATYMKMRATTSGWPTFVELMSLNRMFNLPPEVLDRTDVQHLSLMANNILCWANDIFSFRKEMRCGDVHNLVLTLRHEHQCNLQEAIQRAVKLHDNEVRAFVELETQLPSFGRDIDYQLDRYISSLRSWMRGSLDWLCTSERYRFAEDGFYR